MAIHYYDGYQVKYNSRNFGDDFNKWFLPELFDKSIIESSSLCLVGIGTILNNRSANLLTKFRKKIVFSSGVGYGNYEQLFEDSWHFECVRGPASAAALNLPADRGIADGAILLSDFYPPESESSREGIVFVPHINTHWKSRNTLQAICKELQIRYLSPDVEFDEFIGVIGSACKVLAESMHAAIVADSMRTPWLPVELHFHEPFKWKDWFESISVDYSHVKAWPRCWDGSSTPRMKKSLWKSSKSQFRRLKRFILMRSISNIAKKQKPVLSSDVVMEDRKQRLWQKVHQINESYSI